MFDWQKTTLEKFWAHVEKGKGRDACWNWTGSLSNGYGTLYDGENADGSQRKFPAHVFSFKLHGGKIPKGKELDHTCRNRACVRPSHLEPVTRRINILRGESIVAINARKTHCPKGHPYDERNTIRNKSGSRSCRACRDERYALWRLVRKPLLVPS